MKLLNKITTYYAILAFVLVGVISTMQYYSVSNKIRKRVDRGLLRDKALLTNQLAATSAQYDGIDWLKSERIAVSDTGQTIVAEQVFYTVTEFDNIEGENLKWRYLHSMIELDGVQKHLFIKRSYDDATTFIDSIVVTSLFLILALIAVFILVNRWLIRRLWNPFYATLELLNKFDIESPDKVEFVMSNIEEFNSLNSELAALISKIRHDYTAQRDFIENASHEFQTPLAIMRSKAELLLQSENIREDESVLLGALLHTIDRLSRLNHSLILLSKIGHGQYDDVKDVDLHAVVSDAMEHFEHVAALKELKIEQELDGQPIVKMSETLAEILIVNLIKNAIRHSEEGSKIKIILSDDLFVLKNYGAPLELQEDELFRRFTKSGAHPESTGLGLAIAHEICKVSDLKLSYRYEEGMHCFQVT
jgi:signal transduction histidine kinase